MITNLFKSIFAVSTMLLLSALTFWASAFSNGRGLYYSFNDEGLLVLDGYNEEILSFEGNWPDVIIPEEELIYDDSGAFLGYFMVSGIGNNAFYGCGDNGITSITIPETVTFIGDCAFMECSASVTIPQSVASIGYWAFNGCSGLTGDLQFLASNIGTGAFMHCGNLESVTFGHYGCSTTIGDNAFYDCGSLKSIDIGVNVTYIGNRAFNNCSKLNSITVSSANPSFDSRDNCNAIINSATNTLIVGCNNTVIPNTVNSIGLYAFSGSGLTNVNIPNSVTSIDEAAFYNCTALTNASIGNSVTHIDEFSFSGCKELTTITVSTENTTFDSREYCNGIVNTATNTLVVGCKNTVIPNTVTAIGNNAYTNCVSLISVDIPNSVTSIGNTAFYYCFALADIYCSILDPCKVTMGTNVFEYVPKEACTLHVPKNTTDLYTSADQWKDFVNIVDDLEASLVPGDVSGDGRVNVSDVTALINMILGITGKDETVADVNHDGKINVSDVTALINIILGIH